MTLVIWSLVTVGAVLLACSGLYLFRKNADQDSLRAHHDVTDPMLPLALWIVMFFGAAATIGFTYLLGVESLRIQMAMTSIAAAILSLNIFLLVAFSDAFSGDVRLSPSEFEADRTVMHTVLSSDWQ